MSDFYHIIRNLRPEGRNVVVTVLSGDHFGEKAILSGGRIVYESGEGVFPGKIKEEIADGPDGILDTGIGRIFKETLNMGKKLVICGGGHVSIPVIRIASMIGFHVTVIEDRILFADNARRAGADEVICDNFRQALEKITADENTWFVIVTRGHRYDVECLDVILGKPNAYTGMIGSKARVARVRELMIEKGHSYGKVDAIHAPIGLKIGAETPEEIAVSIMAEIIQVKNREKRGQGYTKELMNAIMAGESERVPMMIATIISRKGSAPRTVGTKMLIFSDGRTIGTIGGGCAEADICKRAQLQLMGDDREPKLYVVDMTGAEAENDGMVCGGVIEVLLERI